jgi:hypothetical protein
MEEPEVYINVNRWIPCGQQLPDDGLLVLIAIEPDVSYGDPVWFAFREGDKWVYESGMPVVRDVSHWMELPAPPAVKA